MKAKEFIKKLFSPILWGNLIAMFVVLIAICLAAWKGMEIYTHHGEGIAVPNVLGMMESDARYTLGRMGLSAVVVDSAFNKSQPSGAILEQTPGEGSKVKKGREIYLTVNSENTPTMPVPDVADNCSLREAEAKLTAMGFKLGPVEYIPGDKDWVYGVKSRGRNVYVGERVPIDVPLVLQVGNNADNFGGDVKDELDDDEWSNDEDAPAGIDDLNGE